MAEVASLMIQKRHSKANLSQDFLLLFLIERAPESAQMIGDMI
jgi:hypothetical protein